MGRFSLVKTGRFGSIQCDVYTTDGEFWMTREQIAAALDYSDSSRIAKLHERHKERLDNLSTYVNLTQVEGGRDVTRRFILYSAKGVYEICRRSQQPKADQFFDWVYELLEGLRTGRLKIENTALEDYLAMSEEDRAIAYFENRKKLAEIAPKAEQYDHFMSGENAQAMNVVAKALGTGRDRLFRFLREQQILMSNNVPYQRYIERGYFKVIEKTIHIGERALNKPQTLVTPRGVDYIARLLEEKKGA